MKKILVYFYPANNLGDDLFLKVLSERYPDHKFELSVCKGYEGLNLKNVNISPWSRVSEKMKDILRMEKSNKFVTVLKVLANSIVLFCNKRIQNKKYLARVLITGSLFQQGAPVGKDYTTLKKYNDLCPNFLIGANFGPFYEDEFLKRHRKKFSEDFVSVSFRDKHSFEFFSDLKNAIYAPDVVLSHDFKINPRTDGDNVVISVMDFEIKEHLKDFAYEYEKKVAEIASGFIDKGKSVTLMSFCEKQGDLVAAQRINKYLIEKFNKEVEIISYQSNIDEVLQVIADSCFVISTRFHSMILGWYFGKRLFPIVYGEKMLHCMQDFDFKGNYCFVDDIDKLELDDVFENYNCDNDVNIAQKKLDANNHFKALDEYLQDS